MELLNHESAVPRSHRKSTTKLRQTEIRNTKAELSEDEEIDLFFDWYGISNDVNSTLSFGEAFSNEVSLVNDTSALYDTSVLNDTSVEDGVASAEDGVTSTDDAIPLVDGDTSTDDATFVVDEVTFIDDDNSVEDRVSSTNDATTVEDGVTPTDEATSVVYGVSSTDNATTVVDDIPVKDAATDEDTTVIKGVPFEIDTTSYQCSRGDLLTDGDEFAATHTEQIVQFDYDLTVELDSGTDVDSVLANFEKILLSFVGSQLMASDCILGGRYFQSQANPDIVLQKISSLPKDSIDKRAICAEDISSPIPTVCYPIKGHLTASYVGDSTLNNTVEQALYDIIDRGMSSNALLTESLLRATFIGVRGTEEINELVTVEPPSKPRALAPSTICVGVLVVIAVAQISYRMKRKYSGSKSLEVENSAQTLTDVENNAKMAIIESPRFPSDYATEIYQQHSYTYDPSIASGETQKVSNRRQKIMAPPMYLVEETLSEDKEEDELQRVHP